MSMPEAPVDEHNCARSPNNDVWPPRQSGDVHNIEIGLPQQTDSAAQAARVSFRQRVSDSYSRSAADLRSCLPCRSDQNAHQFGDLLGQCRRNSVSDLLVLRSPRSAEEIVVCEGLKSSGLSNCEAPAL